MKSILAGLSGLKRIAIIGQNIAYTLLSCTSNEFPTVRQLKDVSCKSLLVYSLKCQRNFKDHNIIGKFNLL